MSDPQLTRLRLIAEVLSALAHDAAQPLNLIRLAAENGLDDQAAPEEARRGLEIAADQAVRLQTWLQRLAGLARGGAPRPLDAAAAVTAALALLRPRCDAEGVAIDWQPPAGTVMVMAQPERLAFVLDTLLCNGLEAVLHARLSRFAAGLRVSCDTFDGQVVVAVADDGPGMPGMVADSLRAEPSGSGAGLGLLLSAGFVADMAGHLVIDASAAGTRVQVTLPAGIERSMPTPGLRPSRVKDYIP